MAATQVKREQVRDGLINNSKVSPSAGITYSKLALTNSLIGGDLTSGAKQTVLESKLDGYFDKVENFTTTSSANNDNVTAEAESAATTLTHTRDGSAEGVLTSGDSSAEWGRGSQNYTCLMRLHSSYDAIDDGENGQVTAYFAHENFFSLTGQITFSAANSTVTGSGTSFTTQLEAGSVLVRVDTEEVIGTVQTITNDTSLTLTANAASSGTNKDFARTKTKGTVTVSQGSTSVSGTGTIFNTDFEPGDALVNPATGNTVGYIADTTGRTDTSMELTSAATEALNGVNAQKREYKLYYHQQDGDAYNFTQATAIDFLFIEVFNEYSKPLLASATGYGFTDVVGVTGTHNHDDRYYTKTQIGSVTDSSSGADLIGFTPLTTSGWNTSNTVQSVVEGMVSDLGDTTANSSGATLIGVEPVGNLSSTDAQAAFEELQGDIDTINSSLGGGSLDDAYNDGSTITVDTTDVDWDLSDNRTWMVSGPGTGNPILEVKAIATGDEVNVVADKSDWTISNVATDSFKMDTLGGILLRTDQGFAVYDDSGAQLSITPAGAAYFAGRASSIIATTNADLTVETVTSGNLTIDSASNAANALDINSSGGIDIDYSNSGDFNVQGGTVTFAPQNASASSFAINTLGGVDVNIGNGYGFLVDNSSGSSVIHLEANDDITLSTDWDFLQLHKILLDKSTSNTLITAPQQIRINSTNSMHLDAIEIDTNSGGIDLNANNSLTLDTTAGPIGITAAGSGGAITLTAQTNEDITLDTSGTGEVVVDGNLRVTGTQTIVNTETIELADNIIVLNSNYTGGSPTEDSGIEVERGSQANVSLFWDESTDRWRFQDLTGTYDILKASETSTTLDSTYDSETGNRIITMDNGSVEWQMTDNYEHNFADSLGNDILSVKALASGDEIEMNVDVLDINVSNNEVDIDTTAGFRIDDDSGSYFQMHSGGNINTVSPSDILLQSQLNVDIQQLDTGAGHNIDIDSRSPDADAILLDAVNGGIDVNADDTMDVDVGIFDLYTDNTGTSSVKIDTLGGIDLDVDAGFTLNGNSGGNFQLQQSGKIFFGPAVGQDFQVQVPGAGNVNLETTTGTAKLFSVSGGKVELSTNNTSATAIVIAATNTGGGIDIDSDTDTSITSANGDITFDDQYLSSAIPISESGTTGLALGFTSTSIVGAINELKTAGAASTLDEAYDGETGNRIITVDTGSVEWQLTDNYEFNVADSLGADIFSVKALGAGDEIHMDAYAVNIALTGNTATDSWKLDTTGGIDIDVDSGINIAEDSGASIAMNASGQIDLLGATDQNVTLAAQGTGDAIVSSVTGRTYLRNTGSSTADSVKIESSSGGIDIDSSDGITIDENSGSYLHIDNTGAIDLSTTDNSLTLQTTGATGGRLILTATSPADSSAMDINSSSGIDIDADSTIAITSSSADVDIDASNGITIDEDSGSYLHIDNTGAIDLSTTDNSLTLQTTGVSGGRLILTATSPADTSAMDINSSSGIDIDAVDQIAITSSSSNIDIDASSGITMDVSAGGITLTASSNEDITLDTSGSGQVVIDGDLTVTGTQTIVNTETIELADNIIVLNSNYTGGSPTEDSGIEVERGSQSNVSLFWDESADAWKYTDLAGTYTIANTAQQNTIDQAYDAETGNRIITMDNGSVEWQITDNYEHNFADALGNDLFSIRPLAAGDQIVANGDLFDINSASVDIDTTNGFTVDDDSGAFLRIQSSGAIQFYSASGQSMTINASSASLSLQGNYANILGNASGSSANAVKLNAVNSTNAAAVRIETANGGIDIDAGNGITIDEDSGSYLHIGNTGAIDLSATDHNLTLQTIGGTPASLIFNSGAVGTSAIDINATAGGIDIDAAGDIAFTTSSGDITFDDQYLSAAIPISESGTTGLSGSFTSTAIVSALNEVKSDVLAASSTLDEAYDSETGNRIITMDNGSVEWQITSGYQHAFADAAGNDILSVEVSGSGNAIDIDVTNGLTIDEDSGAYMHISTGGAIDVSAQDSSTLETTNSNLTIQTTGGSPGTLIFNGGGTGVSAIDINSSGGIDVDAADDVAFTTSSGDITFDDQYLSAAIPISESGTTGLAAGFTATSIVGAINEAFQTAVEVGYEEQTPDTSEASGDYITLTDTSLTSQLPASSKTATELRSSELYVAVYLNGLRLLDTEWSYGYVSSEKRIEFDGTGSSAVDLDTSDDVIVELVKTSA